jgi:hypothetical protein
MMRSTLPAIVFIPAAFLALALGPARAEVPVVVSTVPPDGAADVSRDLATVSITFSKPMDGGISITANFPAFAAAWSTDHRILTLTRTDTEAHLPGGTAYRFVLNPAGHPNFRDTDGNVLPETSFSFTTVYNYELIKTPAAPSKGFDWPYYLSIPTTLSRQTTLLVEPNNTGTWSDDWAIHDAAALSLVRWRSDFAAKLDAPLLVPTFPRPKTPEIQGGIYTQALDRESLVTEVVLPGGSIKRVDLQLIAMIRDAQEQLAARGFGVDSKVFMMGFSASGAFTSRFTMLHPDVVRAAAPGSPGGWPLAPVSKWWGGTTLRYPVGIADVQSLTGQPVDLAGVRRVPQYIYVGDNDTNDALDTRGLPPDETAVICAHLGCGPINISTRWPIAEEMYESVGISDQFVIFPGVAHTITDQMFDDVLHFFMAFKPGPDAALVASVLPASRSVQVGSAATAFAMVINTGSIPATRCGISLGTPVPATLTFQTTNPITNQLTGAPDTPVDIPEGGQQSYVFTLRPSAPIAPTNVQLNFECSNTLQAPVTPGLNTLLFSASAAPTPDVVALAATVGNTGIVDIPGVNGTAAFAVATVNVGASGQITATADTGTASFPVGLSLCQTDPATGACLTPLASNVTTQVNANATPTFADFVAGAGTIVPFDPASDRIFVRFKDPGGVIRGSTSVAVRTQ